MTCDEYISPTPILESDNEDVKAYAALHTGGVTDPTEKAVRLYYAVRDEILYDPYRPFYLPEHYRAGRILAEKRGFCVSKAGLLCALGRSSGIPSRVGFADVRNHLATRELIEFLGSDLFVFHGYTEFFLAGKWVKATPAFNAELCLRHRVSPLDFDGRGDSIFQPMNLEKKKFMEYVKYHGHYADIPVDEIVARWKKAYGSERVEMWIGNFEDRKTTRNFEAEEVI